MRPSRRTDAIWKNCLCSGKRWTATRKSRAYSPECLEMHDEKRPKWRKAESGCGAPAMQERSPDSRDRGGCVDAIAPSADRETETQDGLNSTQNCSRLVLLADPSRQTLTQRKTTSAPAAGKQSQDTITTSASKCVPTLQLVLCPISGSSGSVDSLRRLFCYLHTDLAAVRAFNHRCSKCLIWCAWKRPVYAATVPPKDLLDAVWKLFHHFLLLSTSSPPPPILCTAIQLWASPFGLQ